MSGWAFPILCAAGLVSTPAFPQNDEATQANQKQCSCVQRRGERTFRWSCEKKKNELVTFFGRSGSIGCTIKSCENIGPCLSRGRRARDEPGRNSATRRTRRTRTHERKAVPPGQEHQHAQNEDVPACSHLRIEGEVRLLHFVVAVRAARAGVAVGRLIVLRGSRRVGGLQNRMRRTLAK